MTKITYIPGEIANAAIDEHGNRKPVTRTQHIFDDAEGKSQAEVNKDVDDTLALHQSEINALDSQNYVTVDTFEELPATGAADTIYRVANYDGTQVVTNKYAEYAWDGTQYKLLNVKEYGVDDEPIVGSNNFVKSDGIGNIIKGYPVELTPVRIESGKLVGDDGTITDTEGRTVFVYAVTPNKAYDFKSYMARYSTPYLVFWFNGQGNFISHESYKGSSSEAVRIINQVIVSPPNAAYCYMNAVTSRIEEGAYRLRIIPNLLVNDVRREGKPTEVNRLRNKKVSLMGDSNWTFSGVSTGDSTRYCPGGVIEDVRDTWWGKLLLLSDGTLEVNASVGSSSVTDNERFDVPGYLSRVDTLGNPDCVIIGGGMNEPEDVEVGTFDPTKPIGELNTMVFADAYDKLVRLIKQYYEPEYILMVIHPKVREKFVNVMQAIADYYGIEVVNARPVGDYVTYVDSVHYDFNGAQVVCDYILRSLNIQKQQEGESLKNYTDTCIDDAKQWVKNNTIEEVTENTPVSEPERYYITDKNNVVLGWIEAATGTKHWIQKTDEELNAEDIIDRASSEIEVAGYDNYKFITDNNNVVIGYIDDKGGVFFYNLLNQGGGQEKNNDVTFIMNTVANAGRGPKVLNILNNLPKKSYKTAGYSYKTNAFITFSDDDASDFQIPESQIFGATQETRTTSTKGIGFASFLYAFMKSISERHKLKKKLVLNASHGYDLVDDSDSVEIKGKLTFDICAEGQRIGLLDHIYSDNDTFDGTLNLGGRMAKKLHDRCGWGIACHSMTARYATHSYWVNSLDDPLVAQIEAIATDNVQNHYKNEYIHCEDTNIDYEYRHGEWHEVSDHYIRPYLVKTDTVPADSPLYFNPRYSHKYQVMEWKRRAQAASLPFMDWCAHWGTSSCKKFALEALEYFNHITVSGMGGHLWTNKVPAGTTELLRVSYGTSDDTNRWDDSWYNKLKGVIDDIVVNGDCLALGSHANDNPNRNYYVNGIDYGSRRYDAYPNEWIVPLRQEELETIDENNYWEVPPVRLGINSWAEWYPCPGTTYDMVMNLIEYAIEKGVEFGSMEEVIRRYGNNFNIGLHLSSTPYSEARLAESEKDSKRDNYIIQGCDGSIEYNVQ